MWSPFRMEFIFPTGLIEFGTTDPSPLMCLRKNSSDRTKI